MENLYEVKGTINQTKQSPTEWEKNLTTPYPIENKYPTYINNSRS